MQLEDFLNKLKMIKGLLQLKIMMLNIQHEYADLVSEDFESSDDSYSPASKVHNYTDLSILGCLLKSLSTTSSMHSSLVDYLAQVIDAKNCPTTFYCIFQLVWIPMTTMQNIRVCFLTSNNTLFS